jgi:phosphate transport system substrate-binding protein
VTRQSLAFSTLLLLATATGCTAPLYIHGAGANDIPEKPDATPARLSSDGLPLYIPVANLSGKITSVGESTTTNLVARAATEFRRTYPGVSFQATAGLTSIGPPALLADRENIVPMSRPLTPDEIGAFEKKYGYPPTEIKVAADALAIYVEKRNPLSGLTLKQLDGIFSQTQRRGAGSIETWGQAGLTGQWADRPITLYGYGRGDGVNQIFRQQVMEGGDYRVSMRFEPAGSSIVQGVAADPEAIGCASMFFAAKRVRAVPIAGSDGQFYAPTAENVRGQKYPLSRFHYIYVNKPPRQPLKGPAVEFVRFLLSHEGQQIVAADGNIPLDAATVEQGRRVLAE